jgi:hypothetical protein
MASSADDGAQVVNVLRDDNDPSSVIAHVFGVGNAFYFILVDERDDKPRGRYRSAQDAVNAAWHQAKQLESAEFWELMLDT